MVRIPIDHDKLADFCRKHHIRNLSLFGSVLREDFGPESDVDVLVEFEPDEKLSLFDLVHMEEELSLLLGRKADLVERRGVEASRNYIRRRHILNSLEALYVA